MKSTKKDDMMIYLFCLWVIGCVFCVAIGNGMPEEVLFEIQLSVAILVYMPGMMVLLAIDEIFEGR